jgi:hypothetical protein
VNGKRRSAPKPARVLYDFVASHSYEIALQEGTVVTVLEMVRMQSRRMFLSLLLLSLHYSHHYSYRAYYSFYAYYSYYIRYTDN